MFLNGEWLVGLQTLKNRRNEGGLMGGGVSRFDHLEVVNWFGKIVSVTKSYTVKTPDGIYIAQIRK